MLNSSSSYIKSQDNPNTHYNSHTPLKTKTENLLYEDVEIDKYMSIVDTELKALGYTLDNRAFISNIITILDKLIEPKKFNKTIFFHILDYANLNHDSLILLLDFFRSFFTVYESMKKNKSEIVVQINKCQEEISLYRAKLLASMKEEKILENGLTNNSFLKVNVANINIDYLAANKSTLEDSIKLKFLFGNLTQEIDSSTLNRKAQFSIISLNQLDENLRIYLIVSEKEIFVENINPRDILDNQKIMQFSYENIQFELNIIWMNSKINYFNKEISNSETRISKYKESVDVLNNSISHIEGIFSFNIFLLQLLKKFRYFQEIFRAETTGRARGIISPCFKN